MLKYRSMAALAALMLVGSMLYAEEKKEDPLAGIKCPVSGKAVQADKTVEYKGAKVYFCCPNCPKAFTKDTAKFAAKANQQLVATEQAEQVKCPLSGAGLNPDTQIEVGGAEVAFCCNKCKGKVEAASGDEQINLVFSDAAFAKAYKVKTEEKK